MWKPILLILVILTSVPSKEFNFHIFQSLISTLPQTASTICLTWVLMIHSHPVSCGQFWAQHHHASVISVPFYTKQGIVRFSWEVSSTQAPWKQLIMNSTVLRSFPFHCANFLITWGNCEIEEEASPKRRSNKPNSNFVKNFLPEFFYIMSFLPEINQHSDVTIIPFGYHYLPPPKKKN